MRREFTTGIFGKDYPPSIKSRKRSICKQPPTEHRMVRMRSEPRTQAYAARRAAQGISNKEIQRYLRRYIVRELYPLIHAGLSDAATIT